VNDKRVWDEWSWSVSRPTALVSGEEIRREHQLYDILKGWDTARTYSLYHRACNVRNELAGGGR
jgi:hypothetical protein